MALREQILRAAKLIARPDVQRILVTRVILRERGCLKIPSRGWLLVPSELWAEVENQIPRVQGIPSAMTFGLPVEFVPEESEREKEIVDALVDELKNNGREASDREVV